MERIIGKVQWSIPAQPKATRVAAYARVSTGKDAMLHSLSAQISHYSSLIQKHAGWQYCGVYADEALTGTKDSRTEFQKLLTECKAGNIDLIITKSISRFARNTVTLLETVRELKLMGVDVFFEEQNIHTMSSDGELMMTILASYAQEESRSASENQKWCIRKSFENGELMGLRFLYGYQIEKGEITVDPVTSKIVQEIFKRAAEGESMNSIARDLNSRKISGLRGGEWNSTRIRAILENEKYLGNALLQKSYVNNHLEKKKVKNCGELPMYYAEETHEGIIDSELFEQVQMRLRKCAEKYAKRKTATITPFTGFVKCGKCGKSYKKSGKEKHRFWNCMTFLSKGKAFCCQPQIPETLLYELTAEVIGKPDFTTDELHSILKGIQADGKTLTFCFHDGHTVQREWTHPSRADSWTPEMKKAASERTKRQRRDQNAKSGHGNSGNH